MPTVHSTERDPIQTRGEIEVGIRDNPTHSEAVDELKRDYAWIIDFLYNRRATASSEHQELFDTAILLAKAAAVGAVHALAPDIVKDEDHGE